MRSFDFMAWMFVGLLTIFLITLPTGTTTQYVFGLIAVILLILMRLFSWIPFIRQIFVVLCFSLVLKYLFWRITSTIPPFESIVDFSAALLVLGAEIFCIVMLFTSVFVMINPLPSRRTPPLPERLPTVDVFVPTYNESPSIVGCTLAAAKAMDYDPDRFVVYLLDDGGTDDKLHAPDADVAAAAAQRAAELKAICNELGVIYLARERNEMAKAGNLNFGMRQSSGELVVVFDADHAPSRLFLRETVGHFAEDPRLFLVQTPHTFLNPDPVEKNLSLAGKTPSESEMFYGPVHRGLDSWNASFFCGSAAVLRRTALDEMDGFNGESITEDCETALSLHARGWNSRYVDTPLVRGLQPDTLAAFIGQRSRWCRGMIQIFLLKNPIFTENLSIHQRISYASSCMFWFFPLVRWAFLIAPLLYIFFDMKIYAASVGEFAVYTIPYLLAGILLQGFLFGRYRWPWVSELYEYVQSIHLLGAVLTVIFNPRSPTFNVTDKGTTLERSKLSPIARPFIVMFAILLAGAIYTLYRLSIEPESQTLLLVVGGWNLFNLILAGLALGCACERRERRAAPRLAIDRSVHLEVGGDVIPAQIADVSQGGVLLKLPHRDASKLASGTDAVLMVGEGVPGARIKLRNQRMDGGSPRCGASFDPTDLRRFAVVAELLYTPPVRDVLLPENQRRVRNTLVWSAELMMRSVHQTARGGFYVLRAVFTTPARARQDS